VLQGWIIIAVALTYIGLLFAVASYGDHISARRKPGARRPVIYALSLAVYCTSWTFFGSVGLAAHAGFDFLTIYIGAGLMIGIGYPLVQRIVNLSKSQNITSIADFIAARYGKSQVVGAVVTVIAVIGIVPYIALQLKAISGSLSVILAAKPHLAGSIGETPILADSALFIAIALATFAVLFGTRHIDATEHQDGLVLAIATESVVKLLAFLAVGIFVTFFLFDGPMNLLAKAAERPEVMSLFTATKGGGRWVAMTFLSLVCILLLPRQFHVTVVENNSTADVRKAAWLFPLYLVAINLFVVPIAIAGVLTFPAGTVDADMYVLALPLSAGSGWLAVVAFVGGLSAATAMVIVASVALAIMVCNDLVVPFVLRHRLEPANGLADMGAFLLNVRRMAIFAILLLAYAYYRMVADTAALAAIGLLSFAAVAQFAPVFFGGLVWRRATARGAIAGIMAGISVWAYTLLLPSFVHSGWVGAEILEHGPLGITALRPQMLFLLEFDPLTHGVFWSLFANIVAFVGVSLLRQPEPIERLQGNIFVNPAPAGPGPSFRLWRSSVTVEDLQKTVARYLGQERMQRSFEGFAASQGLELDPQSEAEANVIRFAEHLLASAIGAASSRLVLSLLIKRRNVTTKAAMKLLDDASVAIQYNRDLLQTALDHVRQGLCVFDRDMRLICWNRQFREILELPAEFGRVGVPLHEILRYNAERGKLGDEPAEKIVGDRIEKLVVLRKTYHERLKGSGVVLEVRSDSMPDGGIVATFTDITERIRASDELARANETLERRVRERTEELMRLNGELDRARSEAEKANLGKTHFLAAASHDILQPLNAARLYVTSLVERGFEGREGAVIRNVDASLESVEDILGALLDISRLDTGALKPEITTFRMDELLAQMAVEFAPMAADKGLKLVVVPSSLAVRSDRRLLRRVLQNLIGNAIKYTERGKVLVGCRRRASNVWLAVYDTGPGIPERKQTQIFKEFQRLETNASNVRGLGLGLSIVERISKILDHPIKLVSAPRKGSMFALELPVAAALPLTPARDQGVPAPRESLKGLTVLCIDNEEKILDGMAALLGGWGCQVVKALGERDAVRKIRRRKSGVDIVLADYHLGSGDGLKAIAAVRAAAGRDLPSVLVTADRSLALREEARVNGIPILHKPVKPAALRALLARWLVSRMAAE